MRAYQKLSENNAKDLFGRIYFELEHYYDVDLDELAEWLWSKLNQPIVISVDSLALEFVTTKELPMKRQIHLDFMPNECPLCGEDFFTGYNNTWKCPRCGANGTWEEKFDLV